MKQPASYLTVGRTLFISIIVLIIFGAATAFLRRYVHPLPETVDMDKSARSFEMMSVVLGLLAGGCMAGYFSFDYGKVNFKFKNGALLVSWSYISAIYLLVFLISMPCAKRACFASWTAGLLSCSSLPHMLF